MIGRGKEDRTRREGKGMKGRERTWRRGGRKRRTRMIGGKGNEEGPGGAEEGGVERKKRKFWSGILETS
jgi:hypothetical protein